MKIFDLSQNLYFYLSLDLGAVHMILGGIPAKLSEIPLKRADSLLI